MIKQISIVFFSWSCISHSYAQDLANPDTIAVQSGNLQLKALLWRPTGSPPFPAVIFCHGSYESNDTSYDPVKQISSIAPIFAKNGYMFFGLLRRGVGLSRGQGENSADLMANAFKQKGNDERNKIQLQQLTTAQLQDMIAGLKFLRKRSDVDSNRIAIIGHSFGGSLSLLLAEHEHSVKAVIVFGAASYSWNRSSELRERLIGSIKNITAPIMLIHAENDYSTKPGYVIDSLLNQRGKTHILKIYPKFVNSQREGHNMIFLNPATWEGDVLEFLDRNLKP